MKKTLFVSLFVAAMAASVPAFAEEAAAPSAPAASTPSVTVSRGQMVVAAGGVRLGPVARIAEDGSPRVIFEGRLLTVPLSSLSLVDGRLVSSLNRAQIAAAN